MKKKMSEGPEERQKVLPIVPMENQKTADLRREIGEEKDWEGVERRWVEENPMDEEPGEVP
jgi:hypothetical protein